MTETWRDVKWVYEGEGFVGAYVKGKEEFLVCYVPVGDCQDLIGRAIAHAWNMDLAVTQSWRAYRSWRERQTRELFAVDDSDVKVQDPAP